MLTMYRSYHVPKLAYVCTEIDHVPNMSCTDIDLPRFVPVSMTLNESTAVTRHYLTIYIKYRVSEPAV